MRHVEGDRDARHAVGREPVVGEPEVRTEADAVLAELAVQLADEDAQSALLDRDAQIAHAQIEQPLFGPIGPWRLEAARAVRRDDRGELPVVRHARPLIPPRARSERSANTQDRSYSVAARAATE